MKLSRLWLVVLLSVLLPLRGALAVAMPCAPAGGVGHGVPLAETGLAGHHASHGHAGGHDHGAQAGEHALHEHGGGHGHGHGEDTDSPKCNLCAASCSVPPLPSTSAGLREPTALASVSFPRLSAPATTFQSDGPERPPRIL